MSDDMRQPMKYSFMKFIHIADVHLGAVPDSAMAWSVEREKEIWDSFRNIIKRCNEEQVDLLLIAGDLFHKQPLVRELKEVNYCFRQLEGTKVVLMAGNHDYLSPRSHYHGFQWEPNVTMFYEEELQKVVFEDLNTEVYGFSYLTRDIMEPKYDKLNPDSNDRIHILLAHGGDEKNVPMNRRKLLEAGFDYIALGHIHKPEMFGKKMAYCGSLEPLDKNEIGERGFIRGEISDNHKDITVEFVPSSHRQYKRIKISVHPEITNGALKDQIRYIIENQGKEHIYSFRIVGFRTEDTHYSIQEYYSLGNVLDVKDETIPDYNFDQLLKSNEGNIIGMFIKAVRESGQEETVMNKALYYGIEALLRSKET